MKGGIIVIESGGRHFAFAQIGSPPRASPEENIIFSVLAEETTLSDLTDRLIVLAKEAARARGITEVKNLDINFD